MRLPSPNADEALIKRSLTLNGHATSVALEPIFWRALEDWAAAEQRPLSSLLTDLDAVRQGSNLASSLRVAVVRRLLERDGSENALY